MRLLLVMLAYYFARYHRNCLKLMGGLALIPAAGFMLIFFFGLRNTGIETGGLPIWWNRFRPLHGLCYLGFALYAWGQSHTAYRFLMLDLVLGAVLWGCHHLLY